MWTRAFIWTGIASGAFFATLVVALMILTLNFALGKVPPYGPYSGFGMLLTPGLVGFIVYPACWYFLVAAARDYSTSRTWGLIFVAYALTCFAASAAIFLVGLAAALLLPFNNGGSLVLFTFWPAPVMFGLPLLPLYILIAAPIAFCHRFGLLALFGRQRNI
jgi:hypothetical protein